MMNVMTLILCVFVVIQQIKVSEQIVCGDPPSTLPDSEECCDAKPYKKIQNGLKWSCCKIDGGKEVLYNEQMSVCCAGTLTNLSNNYSGPLPLCCGSEILTHDDGFCCNERAYKNTQEHSYCCGGSFTVGSDDLCCEPKYSSQPAKRHPKNGRTNLYCCGNEVYDIYDSGMVCIQEQLYPKGTILGYCGPTDMVYYKNAQVCCKDTGKLIDIPDSIRSKFIDVDPNLECLNNELVNLDNYRIDYKTKTTVPKHFKQCGTEIYDEKLDRVKPLCCDNNLYFLGNLTNIDCCGSQWFDITKNACCNSKILPEHQLCCANSIPYNRSDNSLACCGSELINAREFMCCKRQSSFSEPVRKKKAIDDRCCGDTTYSSIENKGCCNNTIQDNWGPNKECFHNIVITKTNNVTVEDIRKKVQAAGPRPGNPRSLDCPLCNNLYGQEPCTTKFEYRFVVTSIANLDEATRIQAILLYPRARRDIVINLQTDLMCECFKVGQTYSLFTNRNYETKILQDRVLRFTKRDMLAIHDIKNKRLTPSRSCKIDRWLKKEQKRH